MLRLNSNLPLNVLLAFHLLQFTCSGIPVISLVRSGELTQVGDIITIGLRIDGLTGATYNSLSGFDLDLTFDDTALEFLGVDFVDPTSGINQLDLPGSLLPFSGDASVLPGGMGLSGRIDLVGVSGNNETDLDAFQAASFQFASLLFKATQLVSSTVAIDLSDPSLMLLDSGFGDLSTTFGPTSTQISPSTNRVPETPYRLIALALLLPIGLFHFLPQRTTKA